MKINDGALFAAVAWLLSTLGILGAVGYVTGLMRGGFETPDFVFVELWAILLVGVGLSIYAARLLHRWLVLVFPVLSVAVVFILLYLALPYAVCGQNNCIPAGSHP